MIKDRFLIKISFHPFHSSQRLFPKTLWVWPLSTWQELETQPHQYCCHQARRDTWSTMSNNMRGPIIHRHIFFFFSNKKNCAFTFLPSPFYCGSIFRSSRDVYTMMETRLMKMVAVAFEEGKVQQPQQMVSLTA